MVNLNSFLVLKRIVSSLKQDKITSVSKMIRNISHVEVGQNGKNLGL